jgi:hypothetical protein
MSLLMELVQSRNSNAQKMNEMRSNGNVKRGHIHKWTVRIWKYRKKMIDYDNNVVECCYDDRFDFMNKGNLKKGRVKRGLYIKSWKIRLFRSTHI